MTTNKILSADLLDLVFDDRNKAYGAYELRKTYNKRITKALLITTGIAALAFAGTALAGSLEPVHPEKYFIDSIELTPIKPDEPEPLPPPERQPEPVPVRTIAWTTPQIVEETIVPPPSIEDIDNARIDVFTQAGDDDQRLASPGDIDGQKGIIEAPKNVEPDIYTIVQVPARFDGNWEKFLLRNLNSSVPVDNGAPIGRHKVIVQFVVDIDGTVSEIKAITNAGFGMEEEAIRVLKKADKWEPAIHNGHQVKSYRSQPIIFEVVE